MPDPTSQPAGASAGERQDLQGLEISVQPSGNSALLTLSGDLDLATKDLLQGALDPLLRSRRRPRITRLVVDMTGVRFADASSLCPLLHARAVLVGRGGDLQIRAASAAVRPALQLLCLLAG